MYHVVLLTKTILIFIQNFMTFKEIYESSLNKFFQDLR